MRIKLLLPTMLITLSFGLITVNAQDRGHKSEPEIARMTPEQRVEEYFREYVRHGPMDDYRNLLSDHIFRDGVKALSPTTRAIDDYDPRRDGDSGSKWQRCDDAVALLRMMDSNAVRLRASDEGRQPIEAMRRLSERMRAAGFDSPESKYPKQSRYNYLMRKIKQLSEGINDADEAIRNSLRVNPGVSLSDQQLLLFVNYLISRDPGYPGWSKREYKDTIYRDQPGKPIWSMVMKDPEPFYKAYLQYSFAAKKPD